MKQWKITYTENGQEKTITQLHQEDIYIDDVYYQFVDNSKHEIKHVEFVGFAKKTEYTISETVPYEVFKRGRTFSKGFGSVDSALHSIWTIEGKIERDFYMLIDGVVWKGVKR